ncbi:type II toxin-antitoxin system HipA family toxin [Propionivibrio limicola]|uniref:type II toxin-antitoxin system HipA family toxin n=1 Tax=Propionivibrio limicola TaxID=167645 RepID=UPI001292AAA1|nr:type II toxin-antitoxin system HipA family toxin [Propionivibrio limicola]
MSRVLEVWLLGQHVGQLAQVDGRLSFSYLPEWLQSANTRPLSHHLPLQAEAFDDKATRPFFAGLLPEGDKRKLIAQTLHVSRQNDFALLDGIGGECAGAVSLLETGQQPDVIQSAPVVRWLDEAELVAILDELPRRPMLAGDEGLRLSLAGAQDKLPVIFADGRLGLPLQNTPSSHILKPVISAVEGSVFNEGFCLALAAQIKLSTASAVIHRVADREYLLVDRYDRVRQPDGALRRLHQEDFCQALGVAPEYKYQNEGGPDLAQCFELVRKATRPSAPHILGLLDYVIFNALIGNHDAHAKNFSLIYTERGAALAPLYDALSTAVYANLTDKMAMKIGSKYKFTELQARHWEQFAQAAGLSPAQVKKRVLAIARQLPLEAAALRSSFVTRGLDHDILSKIVDLIERRCQLTCKRLEAAGPGGDE